MGIELHPCELHPWKCAGDVQGMWCVGHAGRPDGIELHGDVVCGAGRQQVYPWTCAGCVACGTDRTAAHGNVQCVRAHHTHHTPDGNAHGNVQCVGLQQTIELHPWKCVACRTATDQMGSPMEMCRVCGVWDMQQTRWD